MNEELLAVNRKIDDLTETVDGLAIIMLNGFERLTNELIEFKKEVAEKFQKVDKQFERVEANFERIDETFVVVRRDIMNTGDRFPSLYMFDGLAKRVTLLEKKKDKGV